MWTRSRNKDKDKDKDTGPAAPPLDKERQKDGRKGLYSGDCVRPSPGAVPSSKARLGSDLSKIFLQYLC